MERRRFLRNLAVTTAALRYLPATADAAEPIVAGAIPLSDELQASRASGPPPSVEGHTLVREFKSGATSWKVYEDLRTRDGAITFISASGRSRVLPKSAEAVFAETNPPYLGLDLKDIGMS